jgi:hypothetical protein
MRERCLGWNQFNCRVLCRALRQERGDSAIKGGEVATMLECKIQKHGIGELVMADQPR